MTIARSVARAVASPVARPVAGGIDGGGGVDIRASAIAAYDLQDDAATTVILDSFGGTSCTLQGGDNTATISTTGPNSRLTKSLQLDGSNDYISRTGHPLSSASAWTMEAYVYLNASGSYPMVISNSTILFDLRMESTTRQPSIRVGSGTVSSIIATSALPLSTWTHLAVTWTGTQIALYVNGTLATAVGSNPITPTNPPTFSNLQIGARDGVFKFPGRIAGVRFWDFALTASQIASIQE